MVQVVPLALVSLVHLAALVVVAHTIVVLAVLVQQDKVMPVVLVRVWVVTMDKVAVGVQVLSENLAPLRPPLVEMVEQVEQVATQVHP